MNIEQTSNSIWDKHSIKLSEIPEWIKRKIISQRGNIEEGKIEDTKIKNFKIEDIRFTQPVENEPIPKKEIQRKFQTDEITFKIIWLRKESLEENWWKKDSYIITFLINDSPTIDLSKEELEDLIKQSQPIEKVKRETIERASNIL